METFSSLGLWVEIDTHVMRHKLDTFVRSGKLHREKFLSQCRDFSCCESRRCIETTQTCEINFYHQILMGKNFFFHIKIEKTNGKKLFLQV